MFDLSDLFRSVLNVSWVYLHLHSHYFCGLAKSRYYNLDTQYTSSDQVNTGYKGFFIHLNWFWLKYLLRLLFLFFMYHHRTDKLYTHVYFIQVVLDWNHFWLDTLVVWSFSVSIICQMIKLELTKQLHTDILFF